MKQGNGGTRDNRPLRRLQGQFPLGPPRSRRTLTAMTARFSAFLALVVFPFALMAGEKNEKCPLMTADDVDDEQLVEYEGVKVLFCCQECRKLFNANPKYVIKASLELLPQFEALMDKLELDKVKLLPQRFCPVTRTNLITPDSPSLKYKDVLVYLWDDKAVEAWKKDPDGCAKRAVEAGLLPQLPKRK
jgi:YHS domain-containing protein